MKKNNNPATVEAIEQTATTNPTHEKAAAILRARFDPLTAHGLNFEKRTGSFFKAFTIKDEEGKEVVKRLVVADEECPADAHESMRIKRASALVVAIEEKREKLAKAVADAEKALNDARANADTLEADYSEAVTLVDAFELPEKAQRLSLSAKVSAQASTIEKMRAALLAAGIDPDALA
ncbi:MAG: hypothetical protein IKB68_06345 [Rikenellaceae bacterium]|nr:hypothetical protein [Rikenellaceae bacterium]